MWLRFSYAQDRLRIGWGSLRVGLGQSLLRSLHVLFAEFQRWVCCLKLFGPSFSVGLSASQFAICCGLLRDACFAGMAVGDLIFRFCKNTYVVL